MAKCRPRQEVYKIKKTSSGFFCSALNNIDYRKKIHKIVKQQIKGQNRDAMGEQCVRDRMRNVVGDQMEIRNIVLYLEKLL